MDPQVFLLASESVITLGSFPESLTCDWADETHEPLWSGAGLEYSSPPLLRFHFL